MEIPAPHFGHYGVGGYEPAAVDALVATITAATAADPPALTSEQVLSPPLALTRFGGYSCQDVDAWLSLVAGSLPADEPAAHPAIRSTGLTVPSVAEYLELLPKLPNLKPRTLRPGFLTSRRGDRRTPDVVQRRPGVSRWVVMTVVSLAAVALILTLYFSGFLG